MTKMAMGRTIFFLIFLIFITNPIRCDNNDKQESAEQLSDMQKRFRTTNQFEELTLRSPAGNSDEGYLNKLWKYYHGIKSDYDGPALPNLSFYTPKDDSTNVPDKQSTENGDTLNSETHDYVTKGYAADSETSSHATANSHNHHPSSISIPSTIRYGISKRSNSYRKTAKRSAKKQTDPKIEKDLKQYFRGEQQQPVKKLFGKLKVRLPMSKKNKKLHTMTKKSKNIEKMAAAKKEINKEIFSPVPEPPEKKSMDLKKKSVNWSDYFGLDRRKKSENSDGLDKEWLLERYHKAIALSTDKKNTDLPLKSFRNHNLLLPSQQDLQKTDEEKINEMDAKLEKVEDEIVEEALKYSGAHQDFTNTEEVQQMKTAIIARLAQAYNIEKMRDTLKEYKAKLGHFGSNYGKSYENYFTEEKRPAVPRKEAIDGSYEMEDVDNSINCIDGDDCHEDNYKTSPTMINNHFGPFDQCPAIERACNDIASLVGHYGHIFEAACHIHQMCMLCGSNSWFSPTRPCNMLYLNKAYELCSGKQECKTEARRSIRYLLDVNKSLQCQSNLNDECELRCPDTDPMAK